MKHCIRCLCYILFGVWITVKVGAQTMLALTGDNKILMISSPNVPSVVSGPYAITGIAAGQTIVGIDYRPSDGRLYALAYDAATSKGQLYTLAGNGKTYSANPVNIYTTMELGTGNGTGFDFDPTQDNHITVTARNGALYILDADNGTIVFTSYSKIDYLNGDTARSLPVITGIAYTGNFYGTDSTLLTGFDASNNTIVQFNENNPQLIRTVGSTGLAYIAGEDAGMDSYYDTATRLNRTYLVTRSSSGSALYGVTSTGTLINIGTIGRGNLNIRDIAIEVYHRVPDEIDGPLVIGLSMNKHNLLLFDSEHPGIIRDVKHIAGVTPGQSIIAIDFRPADNMLYGFGYNYSNDLYQLYRIDIGTGGAAAINTTPYPLGLANTTDATNIGFDFNPVNDRIKITARRGFNVRIDPNTGGIGVNDSIIHYATSDVNSGNIANVFTLAYTNSYNFAGNTQLLGIDYNTASYVEFLQSSATLKTNVNLSDQIGSGINANAALDVYYDSTTASNWGYFATNSNGIASFYALNIYTGFVMPKGDVGAGLALKDIAMVPGYVNQLLATSPRFRYSDVYVYPNPAISQANIVLPQIAKQRVNVYLIDLQGTIMQTYAFAPGGNQLYIDISSVPVGIYSLRIEQKGMRSQNVRLVKQ